VFVPGETLPMAFSFSCNSTHVTLNTCYYALRSHFTCPVVTIASVQPTLLAVCQLQQPGFAFTSALACNGWGMLVKIHTVFCSGRSNLHDLETLSESHANCTKNQQMMMALYQACLADDTRCMTCDNQWWMAVQKIIF